MQLTGWNDPDPAEVHHPTNNAEWDTALSRYLGSLNDAPLQRCVEVARSHGAATLVIETRYLDIDYRSEFSAYYSRQFADVPDSAHRLHFFGKHLDSQSLWHLDADHDYIGYVVTRAPSFRRVSDGRSLKGLGGGRGDGQWWSLVEGLHDTAALGPPGVADRHQEDAPQSAS